MRSPASLFRGDAEVDRTRVGDTEVDFDAALEADFDAALDADRDCARKCTCAKGCLLSNGFGGCGSSRANSTCERCSRPRRMFCTCLEYPATGINTLAGHLEGRPSGKASCMLFDHGDWLESVRLMGSDSPRESSSSYVEVSDDSVVVESDAARSSLL